MREPKKAVSRAVVTHDSFASFPRLDTRERVLLHLRRAFEASVDHIVKAVEHNASLGLPELNHEFSVSYEPAYDETLWRAEEAGGPKREPYAKTSFLQTIADEMGDDAAGFVGPRPSMPEGSGLLLKADVVDGDGDLFPKEAVEAAVRRFNEGRGAACSFVSRDYGRSTEDIAGIPVRLRMEGDEVHVDMKFPAGFPSRGDYLMDQGYKPAIAARVIKSRQEGDVRVIEEFDIDGVSLVRRRIPLERPQGGSS